MTINPDDPKLTAYVLGELDEKERAEVEAQLAGSAELRRAVDEIRKTTELLTKELESEPAIALSAAQRLAIEAKAAKLNGRPVEQPGKRPWLIRHWLIPTSLAASLLLAAVLWPSLAARRYGARSLNGIFANVDSPLPAGVPAIRTPGRSRGAPSTTAHSRNVLVDSGQQPSSIALFAGRGFARNIDLQNLGYVGDAAAHHATNSTTLNYRYAVVRHPTVSTTPDGISFGVQTPSFADQLQYQRGDAPSGGDGEVLDMMTDAWSTEAYDRIVENPFLAVTHNRLSTFSIDVDTASYANMRRFLNQGRLPPPGAVRIEELVNYFDYDYPPPTGGDPFSVSMDVADCPWKTDHLLARIAIKGQEFAPEERPPANLVFLIDVSGSMQSPNKLSLLKQALRMLVDELAYDDYVAVVVYAGASGLVLPSTSCDSKGVILDALDRLRAGGSTNGGAGIQLAYDTAVDNFIEGGINRVILATDGDFNVGVTSQGELIRMIEEKAESGVFLSVLGFGMGNYQDSTLEKLADKGNGNYAYIDTLSEARKVLVDQMGGTLITIAKDVKIQIEFNPAEVNAYRLIGYENRMLRAEDFNDDTKDAGEIGAGHTVTAFYEIAPAGVDIDLPAVDPLKYRDSTSEGSSQDERPRGLPIDRDSIAPAAQDSDFIPAAQDGEFVAAVQSGELMTVKLRYKGPDGDTSKLIEVAVRDGGSVFDDMSDDFVFGASVASFGMLLRGSQHSGDFTFDAVRETALTALGEDPFGYRTEFVSLVEKARDFHSKER